MFARRLAAMRADLAHDPWPEIRELYRRILDVLDERVARDPQDLKTGELFDWLDGRVRDEINVVLGFWMPPSLWTAFAEVFPDHELSRPQTAVKLCPRDGDGWSARRVYAQYRRRQRERRLNADGRVERPKKRRSRHATR